MNRGIVVRPIRILCMITFTLIMQYPLNAQVKIMHQHPIQVASPNPCHPPIKIYQPPIIMPMSPCNDPLRSHQQALSQCNQIQDQIRRHNEWTQMLQRQQQIRNLHDNIHRENMRQMDLMRHMQQIRQTHQRNQIHQLRLQNEEVGRPLQVPPVWAGIPLAHTQRTRFEAERHALEQVDQRQLTRSQRRKLRARVKALERKHRLALRN